MNPAYEDAGYFSIGERNMLRPCVMMLSVSKEAGG